MDGPAGQPGFGGEPVDAAPPPSIGSVTTPEQPGVRYARDVGPGDAGVRVSLRHRTADGRLTDVLGELEGWDDTTVRVRDRHGALHAVAAVDVVAAKRVPPPPERR